MRKSDAIYDVSLEANLSPSLIPVSELHPIAVNVITSSSS